MILSLIGVMLFSMTMAITLAIIVSAIKKNPGIAFGFTTIGLFIGTLPIFFFGIRDLLSSILLILIIGLLANLILLIISKEEHV